MSYPRSLGWAVIAEQRQEWRVEKFYPFLNKVLSIIAMFIIADLFILFASMAQIMAEGRTGYWSPFWAVQAKFLISLIN